MATVAEDINSNVNSPRTHDTSGVVPGGMSGPPRATPHQRAKSSVLRSFIHRRNNSDGAGLAPSLLVETTIPANIHQEHLTPSGSPIAMAFSRQYGGALGEFQQNEQDQTTRSPRKTREERNGEGSERRGRSPIKSGFGPLSLRSMASREQTKMDTSREPSPHKPKKTMSAANLTGFLARPKSQKNLHKIATDEDMRKTKDKENRSPPNSMTGQDAFAPTPPIYAQFCADSASGTPQLRSKHSLDLGSDLYRSRPGDSHHGEGSPPKAGGKLEKQRPKSIQAYYLPRQEARSPERRRDPSPGKTKTHTEQYHTTKTTDKAIGKTQRGAKVLTAIAGLGTTKAKATTATTPTEPFIDPKQLDTHLEAMLDRRNIPENQRYKMRNLNNTIKMEFVRQDWAEMQVSKTDRSQANENSSPAESSSAIAPGSDREEHKTKRTRGRSFTLSRGNKDPGSPTKKSSKGEGTIGRHFRSKSTESIASDRPSSAGSSGSNGILSKIKFQQGPGDFVAYLRKVQKPELVEVGKLHKLRLLLRNETVAWTEDFIRQGGIKEIVDLLNRIMDIEWR
jgi:hypothetical protein